MDHATCLLQLEELRASPGSLRLVGSFLEGRIMTIKLGGQICGERTIIRGRKRPRLRPLLCNDSEPYQKPRCRRSWPSGCPGLPASDEVWMRDLPAMGGGRIRFFPGGSSGESEGDINFWDNDKEVPELWNQGSASLETEVGEALKYIDDTTVFEAVSLDTSVKHFTTKKTIETITPWGLQSGLVDLAKPAEDIGMKVNVLKTQLLCISQRRVDSFITKVARNPRFRHWFPVKAGAGMELRRPRRVEETRAKTERRYKGPLAYMRRRANELGNCARMSCRIKEKCR